MTDEHERTRNGSVDPLVSAEYHDLGNETVPAKLNRAVLHASRKALRNRRGMGWQSAWFRPLASAAVIVLSLAVMLEFNKANNTESSFAGSDEISQVDDSADVFREAADSAAVQLREAEAAASRAAENSTPDEPPAMGPGTRLDQSTLLPIDGGCDETQRSTMTTWWQCIESLENRGASVLAEQELAALLGSYPAFIKPGQ